MLELATPSLNSAWWVGSNGTFKRLFPNWYVIRLIERRLLTAEPGGQSRLTDTNDMTENKFAARGHRRRHWAQLLVVTLLAAFCGWTVLAQNANLQTDTTEPAQEDGLEVPEGARLLIDKLTALRPDLPIVQVRSTPLEGMYVLEISGGALFYGTDDGRYLFAGDLYELGEHDLINHAEVWRVAQRHRLLASVNGPLVFPAEGSTKAIISVFTDVDCGYCRRLHQEVPKLNQLGVEVRYLAFPRAGVGSRSYQKIVSAWCSADPNTAITRLKAGQTIPDIECKNPVMSHYELGRELGVAGTPSIVLEDGSMLPGFVAAEDLALRLGI